MNSDVEETLLSRISITSSAEFGTGGGADLGGDGARDFFFIFGGKGGVVSLPFWAMGEGTSSSLGVRDEEDSTKLGVDISISTVDRWTDDPLLEKRRTTRASFTTSGLKDRHGLLLVYVVDKFMELKMDNCKKEKKNFQKRDKYLNCGFNESDELMQDIKYK